MRRLTEALRRLFAPGRVRLAEDKRRLEAICRTYGLSRTVSRRVVADFFNQPEASK